MKATTIVKVNPIAEILTPSLLQCKTGACGGCPNNTGKMLWIPGDINNNNLSITFTFRYNFFDSSTASTSAIKYNLVIGNVNGTSVSYSNPPDKAWATANHALSTNPILSPSLMSGSSSLTNTFPIPTTGTWLFFRQPNPAIGNVHDGLCFEYNNERRLITFRSF
jgi:hypothetical protein